MTLPPSPPRPRWTAGRVAAALATVAVVAVVFAGALPQVADYREVGRALRALPGPGLVLLLGLTAVHLAAFGLVLARVIPGLGRTEAVAVHLSSTAVAHTVPAGGAVAVGVQFAGLRVLGHGLASVTAGLAAAGLWDNAGRLLLLAAGAGLTALAGDAVAGVLGATGFVLLLGLLGLVVAAFRSERFLLAVGGALSRPAAAVWRGLGRRPIDLTARLASLKAELDGIVRARWRGLTALTLLYHLSLYALLVACLRLVGVGPADAGWPQVLPVFALARVVTVVPVTPGGVGIVELGYVALLAGDAGDEVAVAVTAAVLLFRALSYVLPIVLGVAAWLLLPRLARRRRSRGGGTGVGRRDSADRRLSGPPVG